MPTCPICGDPVIDSGHGGPRKIYCSRRCRSRSDSIRNGKEREKRRVRDLATYQRTRYQTDPAWRSRRLAGNSARYALTRGAPNAERFTLDEIYARDGGKCHLCGKRVHRTKASMDHLIPVSLGGPHVRANVALACRSCNSSKKTKACNEQLRLIG